jgi:hypothetical protein
MPKGLIPLSPFAARSVYAGWPSAPSLIHVDQRQHDLRWSGNVMNSYSRGPKPVQPPKRGARIVNPASCGSQGAATEA